MKKLVLFIHGLGGDAAGTWKKFPELLRSDSELAALYDLEPFEYSTGAFGSKPPLATVAALLKTKIDNQYKEYSDIALIAHSQGGLIARYYIAERLNSSLPLRVSRLLTFATPHHGSGFATLLKHVPFTSQQSADLDPNSQFLQALGIAWGQAKADRRVLTKYAVAADDAIVGPVSAMGQWNPGYETIGGVGHTSSVKPKTAEDTSFLVARNFLLEEPLLPGGVEADYQAPLLRFNPVDPVESARFIYSARVLPLIGRDAEVGKLADFLGGPEQPFRWMVLHGSGGVGKSRLALEFCLAIRSEWHAGFLEDGQAADPVWGKWQPLMQTLIVIDAAARDTDRTGRLLQALAGRGPADGTAKLAAPVRVLLVERMGEGEWLNKIMGDETKKAQLKLAQAPNLRLETIDDPWPIFEFVLKEKNKPLPDKAETLAALAEIDSERRPLFAYFMADAIARGVDIRQFDAACLLEQVIAHSRNVYWNPAGATVGDERLLAVATMAGGLPVSALESVTEKPLLPTWDLDRHPAIFLAMTGRESGENIGPLEPDIIGEHFALECLKQTNLSDANRTRLCELAWRLNPLGMAQFMLRAHNDLPDDPMLRWVRKLPPSEVMPQLLWSLAAPALMIHLRSRDPAAAWSLLNDVRGVAEAHGEAALWEEWARAAFNLMIDLQSRDPVAARTLLDFMRGVADKRGEAALWTQWAKAAVNLMNDLSSRDFGAARTLLDDMRSVADKRGEAALWEEWAMAAFNLTNDLQSLAPDAARALLDDMCGVAQARGEAALWEWWAKGAFNLMSDLRSRDPEAARALLGNMRSVADKRGEAAIWELWAKAAVNLLNDLSSRDTGAARTLLDDMRGVAQERGEAALWELWATAAFNLIVPLGSRDPAAAWDLLTGMRAVAVACDKAALLEWYAKAAVNLMNDLRSRNPVAARTLLDDMRDVAEARDEAALWEERAEVSYFLIVALGSGDRAASRALVDDMLKAVERHPGDVGGWQTMVMTYVQSAAFSLTKDLASRDPAAARTLSAEVLGLPDWFLQKMQFGD